MIPFAAALATIRLRKRATPETVGQALADLRRELMDDAAPSEDEAAQAFALLGRIAAVDNLPPDADLIAQTVDLIAFRIKATSRAEAWRACRLEPTRGREMLNERRPLRDWSVWLNLRGAALDWTPGS